MKICIPILSAALYISLATGTPSLAQDQTLRTIDVPAGKTSQLSVHSGAFPDCSPKPLVDIRVDKIPSAGTLAVRDAKVRVRNGNCAGKEFPARIVLYQAPARVGATDSASYTVTSGDRVNVFGVNINVVAPKP
ncbi:MULTISPECIES: hypothetical protein [unclassified Chelatococcus]|uniref:hypothetical protein n=1 Tax=unclassified Chelatococcus TaxID=2638111 RepID=UPI001BCDD478|nr:MULTISPECIES: hypothetical protein [unclassified Chelatococcus]MBS7698660.1 hypothetical protein [Chelatococcus sp. YT9]MBX3554758.1 hypothetical protein [Chelatococcus sp.]